ncbi:uncharacterized protein LOC131651047 [Vicia villosa]|uniref:uncharacterized protein LOC131651047 n=1 Tax=Vicia villosa TaxID=3911 RepID=UPI00273C7922|nr:uncharacterized protein LOC131651047 [Vicia villosa]
MTAQNTVSYVFNINNQISTTMQARRGLRQGDPISPLLFVIMMEYLNRLLDDMQENYNFNHHAKCEKLGITNLTSVDDVLLFCRGEFNSVTRLLTAVSTFSASTGLIINPKKCKVFFGGMDSLSKAQVLEVTKFDEGQLPFQYLGIPITSKWMNNNHYMPLIDRITSKFKHWSSRIFMWTGKLDKSRKIHVAWKTMCSPTNQGGQNICSLPVWNKVPWRFLFHGNMARPRAFHVAWIACHGNLATKDRLCWFNLIKDSK